MTRHLLVLAGLWSLAAAAVAQQDVPRTTEMLSALRPFAIQFDNFREQPPLAVNCPFSHFQVIDLRPDTSRIGVHGNLPMRSHAFDRQLRFRRSAAEEISGFLNRHFAHPAGNDTAVIILRYLWLSDTDPSTAGEDAAFRDGQNAPAATHIRLRAEIYLRRGGRYLPLLRFDTLQQTRFVMYSVLRSTYLGWDRDLAALFRELAQAASAAAARKASAVRWIGWEDIRRFNEARFDIPIFDSTRLKRGVYTGFEEFRNNAPSIRDFEVLPENGSLALYLRNNDGSSYYTHTAWGICDGKQVFIMRDGLLHLLRKDGHSFFFYGIDMPAADLQTLPLSVFNGSPEQHCLYVVDMDTGQFN